MVDRVLTAYLLVVISVEIHGIKPRVAWTVWSTLLGLFLLIGVLASLAARARSTPWEKLGQPGGTIEGTPRLEGQGMMPPDSPDMKAMAAYFDWMKRETKPQDKVPGARRGQDRLQHPALSGERQEGLCP